MSADFNSHTPCGVRRIVSDVFSIAVRFQLTHPMRGATRWSKNHRFIFLYFNSHTPCGVRRLFCGTAYSIPFISTHTPHAGCDAIHDCIVNAHVISTHTPHAGCDLLSISSRVVSNHFNSHTPCGVRHMCRAMNAADKGISTHTPHAGCDKKYDWKSCNGQISTHTPHAGCDHTADFISRYFTNFNSHTPCGVRHLDTQIRMILNIISTHTPHAGCDQRVRQGRRCD